VSLPLIDLTAPDPADVDAICRDTGFLAVVGHGASSELIDETWKHARAFFDLPLDKKMTVAMPNADYPYGYAPYRNETLARSVGEDSPPDLKETFSIGPQASWSSEGVTPTLWPAEPTELASTLRRTFVEMGVIAERIMSLFARALDLPEHYFVPYFDNHASALRILNYPELEQAPARGQLRAGAHSDYGSLTLLLAEPGSTGLQIQEPSGTWRPVSASPEALIVNVGDLLSRWSNDRWVSTIHRVQPTRARRQSIAFFHLPNWDAEITCIPGAPAKYDPVIAGEHLMSKYRKTVAT